MPSPSAPRPGPMRSHGPGPTTGPATPRPRGSPAVCLLSGGLDSCVAAAVAKDRGFEIVALSFDYGQRHIRELESAQAVAKALGALRHERVRVDLGTLGGSALTDRRIDVPKDRDTAMMASEIPVTYVPARNTIFLSYALAVAEIAKASDIFIGANALDYSGYPDCRPEYFEAFRAMGQLATKSGVEGAELRIEVPLLELTKADIVRLGMRLHAPLHLTWSCYEGGSVACGRCDSCKLRLKGFAEAGVPDPIPYAP
ncbi:MAG: 7-cyano-7-deazaguanine synthase QueC [Thermoplasmatota archaeon]